MISTVDPEDATTGSLFSMAAANENSDLFRCEKYVMFAYRAVAGTVLHFSHSCAPPIVGCNS